MNCHRREAELVDLARGIKRDTAAGGSLRGHLDQCPSCAARFAREQDLSAGLQELVADMPESRKTAAIEKRLLLAFAARQANPPASAAHASRWWLSAAALLLVGAGAWIGIRNRPSVGIGSHAALPEAVSVVAQPPAPEDLAPPAEARQTQPAGARPTRRPPLGGAPRASETRKAAAGQTEVLRFVSLPAAAGLPGLESGRIVRIELPMAVLPAYGVDVPPEDAGRIVEADVLVGQDGEPRAIRIVGPDSGPRRRQ